MFILGLCFIISKQIFKSKNIKKLIYCTRTVVEMDKALKELQLIIEKRKNEIKDDFNVLAFGFTARKNLCIND